MVRKKIALFSDGTGNSASTPHKTNVWRAYQALDLSDGDSQVAFYDNGVGTSAFTPMAILGLAFGWGLARNVRQIYGFLCRTYVEGDEIYGFGFSRGAFTMRVAAALIASEGIIDRDRAGDDRDLDRLIKAAYNRFRRKHFTPSLLSFFLRPVRDKLVSIYDLLKGRVPYDPNKNLHYREDPASDSLIKFLGVWDTVDAYGFPVDELTRAWDMVVWPLSAKDRNLSPRIARACHALALDEQRESFEPMLWNEDGMQPKARLEDERLSQVWFPGVHANVGGGYPDDGLALVALDWMIGQCEELIKVDEQQGTKTTLREGLRFVPEERERIKARAGTNAPLYDSRSGIGNLYRYAPRHIERLCTERKPGLANWLKEKLGLSKLYGRLESEDARKAMDRMGLDRVHHNEVRIESVKIHHTVFDRLSQDGRAYAPINLPRRYAYVDNQGNVIDIGDPGTTHATPPESAQQAEERWKRQCYAWNRVWRRKMLYFITLAAILYFVSYPYWAEPGADGHQVRLADLLLPVLGTFGVVVQQIPMLVGKIPGLGFAEDWATKYQQFPLVFFLGILIIGSLLAASLRIGRLLKAEMRMNWQPVTGSGKAPTAEVSGFTQWLSNFLEKPLYTDKIARVIRLSLETVAALLLIAVLAALGNRLLFIVADSAGTLCSADTPLADSALGKPFAFNPADACFDTGLSLEKGKTYKIRLQVSDWKDKTIDADVKGWCQDWCQETIPWQIKLLTPIRRHLFADWYQPMARIDNKLLERYPLALKEPDPRTEQKELIAEITAHRSGRLYLYLNDVVLFAPGGWNQFYANNRGRAWVTVTESSSE